jgi:hypothetical protein
LLAIHDAENVAVRILEPGHLDVARDVNVALAPRVRQIVVLEPDALRLEPADDILDSVGTRRRADSLPRDGSVDIDAGIIPTNNRRCGPRTK